MKPTILFLLVLLLCGCRGTFDLGIEMTPTPDRAAPATIVALQAENARLATAVAARVTPTPTPLDLGRVAYLQGGDIWVKTLPDGKPLRLTTDGRNREPHWSPSGNWVAFRKERPAVVMREEPCDPPRSREVCREPVSVMQQQLWLVEANGANARPLNQGLSVETFAWSPARDELAYVTAGGWLETIHAYDAEPARWLSYDAERAKIGRIAWSPDGSWLAYEWSVSAQDQEARYQGIWKIGQGGRDKTELYASGAPKKGDAILAGWTPQGKTVLFWQDQTRATFPTDGAMLYGVSADPRVSANEAVFPVCNEPVLLYSDFVVPAPLHTKWGALDTIALVIGSGRGTWANKRILITNILTPSKVAALFPAWSPDGMYVAYVSMPARDELITRGLTAQELMERRLWIADLLGGTPPQQLTGTVGYRDERPLWSADGSHILFARLDARGSASLWIINARGGAARQVIDELTPAPDPFGSYGHIAWDTMFAWWRGAPR